MKLPKRLHARIAVAPGVPAEIVAAAQLGNVLDGDGPMIIGVYQLVETLLVRKTVIVETRTEIRA